MSILDEAGGFEGVGFGEGERKCEGVMRGLLDRLEGLGRVLKVRRFFLSSHFFIFLFSHFWLSFPNDPSAFRLPLYSLYFFHSLPSIFFVQRPHQLEVNWKDQRIWEKPFGPRYNPEKT